MRIIVIVGCCAALLLSACGGSSKTQVSPTSSTGAGGSTSTTAELSTTSLPCQPIPVPTTPVTSPAPSSTASLLTRVEELGDHCVDHVIFDFTAKGSDPPGYTLTYGTPPFTADASGKTIPVAGNAFIVVKVQPGYGYDFETSKPTYTGPRSVPVKNTNHVQSIVETGDLEGVLTWVIGLDAKRPFSVQATGTPNHQLVVTVS